MHGRLGHDRSLHHTREAKSRDGKKVDRPQVIEVRSRAVAASEPENLR